MNTKELREKYKQATNAYNLRKADDYFTAKANAQIYGDLVSEIRKYDPLFKMSLSDFCDYAREYLLNKNVCDKVLLKSHSEAVCTTEGKGFRDEVLYHTTIPVIYELSMMKQITVDGVVTPNFVDAKLPFASVDLSLTTNYTDCDADVQKIRENAIAPATLENTKINLLLNPQLHLDSFYSAGTDLTKFNIDADDMLWYAVDRNVQKAFGAKMQ